MNLKKLKELEKQFLKKYPDGFADPHFEPIMKKHQPEKMRALAEDFFSPTAFKNTALLTENLAKFVTRSSMVSLFEKPKFRDFVCSLSPAEAKRLVAGLQKFLHTQDQAGGFDGIGADFGQSIDRFREQAGRGVGVAVEFFVHGGVAQPEVGAEVDHLQPALQQGGRDFRRHAVRQREESRLGPGRGDRVGIRLDEGKVRPGQLAETREHRGKRLAGLLAGGGRDEFDLRVDQQQAEQFLARVSAGTDDGCLDPLHGEADVA